MLAGQDETKVHVCALRAEGLRSMRKGEHVIVIRGPYAGKTGIIQRRGRHGGYIVNLSYSPGIPASPLLKAGEIRRVRATQNGTGPDKT